MLAGLLALNATPPQDECKLACAADRDICYELALDMYNYCVASCPAPPTPECIGQCADSYQTQRSRCFNGYNHCIHDCEIDQEE
jgi:hypothetical protein